MPVRLFDPKENRFVTVGDKFVEQFKAKGLTEQRPSQKQISDIESSARKGVQKFTTPSGGTTTTKPTDALFQGIVKQDTTGPEIPKDTTEDLLTKQSDAATNELVSALKQRISESIAGQEQLKAGAAQQFDPLRAQSEVAKSQQLRSALERSSLRGDRGGVGRTEALLTQTAGEKRLTDINLQQQNFVNQADAEIARLENEGKFQEAQIVAGQKAQLLQNLLGEQARQEELGTQAVEAKFQEELANIGQYSQDFTAEADRRQATPDTADDRLIPFLRTEARNKLAGIAEGEAAGREDARDFAMDKWNKGIPLSREEMDILGTTRSTKPVKPTGGTSQSVLFNQADKLVSRGIPLNAAQAAAYGVEEGFVDPNFEGRAPEDEDTTPLFSDSDINFSISRAIKNDTAGLDSFEITPQMQTESVKNWLMSNGDNISDEQLNSIVIRYGLSDADIDDMDARTSPNRQEAGVGGLNLP